MLSAVMPLIILAAGAYGSYFIGGKRRGQSASGSMAALVMIASFLSLLSIAPDLFSDKIVSYTIGSVELSWGLLGLIFSLSAVGVGVLLIMYSMNEGKRWGRAFYPLILLSYAGMIGVACSTDIFSLYLFFELMTVPTYGLIMQNKNPDEAAEASVKYAIQSVAGTLFLLFGIALLVSMGGTTSLSGLGALGLEGTVPAMAVALLVIGFGTKLALVPMHTWLPDAYTASSSSFVLLSTTVTAMGAFSVLLVFTSLASLAEYAGQFLLIFAILSMFVGNLMAFAQLAYWDANTRRILGYSSIAHMGYIMAGVGLGLMSGTVSGLSGGMFHAINSIFMKGVPFLILGFFVMKTGSRRVRDLRGLGRAYPLLSLAFTISLLALSGAPPFSGFMGEWMIVKGGIDAASSVGVWGSLTSFFIVINSVFSLGYYLPMIRTLYQDRRPDQRKIMKTNMPGSVYIPVLVLVALIVILGIWPEPLLRFITPAVRDILVAMEGLL